LNSQDFILCGRKNSVNICAPRNIDLISTLLQTSLVQLI